MSQAPSMPMYWDAYLADTTHLSTEEHGAYMLLLAAMWRRNGYVPDDDRDNARILGLTIGKWRKIKVRLRDTINGMVMENGTITQKKLLEIWKKTQEKIEKNKTNGAKGGRSKSLNNSNLAKANATNSLKRKATIPEPEPEPEPKRKRKRKGDTNVSPKKTPEIVLMNGFNSLEEEFSAVWAHNPKPVDRKKAFEQWKRKRKDHSFIEIAKPALEYFKIRQGEDQHFTKVFFRWLRDERFTESQSAGANRTQTTDDRMDALMGGATRLDDLFPEQLKLEGGK